MVDKKSNEITAIPQLLDLLTINQYPALRVKGHTPNRFVVPFESAEQLATPHVPELHRVVVASARSSWCRVAFASTAQFTFIQFVVNLLKRKADKLALRVF